MDRIWAFLRRFRVAVFINNLNVSAGESSREFCGGRAARPLLLPSTTPAVRPRPRLQIHLAPNRRELRGNEAAIRAGWQATIRSLEAQNEGGKTR